MNRKQMEKSEWQAPRIISAGHMTEIVTWYTTKGSKSSSKGKGDDEHDD